MNKILPVFSATMPIKHIHFHTKQTHCVWHFFPILHRTHWYDLYSKRWQGNVVHCCCYLSLIKDARISSLHILEIPLTIKRSMFAMKNILLFPFLAILHYHRLGCFSFLSQQIFFFSFLSGRFIVVDYLFRISEFSEKSSTWLNCSFVIFLPSYDIKVDKILSM